MGVRVSCYWDGEIGGNGIFLSNVLCFYSNGWPSQFDKYYIPTTNTPTPVHATKSIPMQYGSGWMHAAVLSWQSSEQTVTNPRQELAAYLSSPVEDVEDVVRW